MMRLKITHVQSMITIVLNGVDSLIDVKSYVAKRKEDIKEYLKEKNPKRDTLVVFQFGNNPASNAYVKGKKKDCEEVGLRAVVYNLTEDTSLDYAARLMAATQTLDNVAGIIVQLPIPEHLSALPTMIKPEFDVDGFLPTSKFVPATPKGVIELLDNELKYNFVGKVCTVIGKSHIVGEPCANLIKGRGATVIWCDSHTVDLKKWCLQSGLIVTATGQKGLITPDMIRPGTVVVDVGIIRGGDGKLCGDVDKDCYSDDALITPVPGGVGLLTRVALLENLVYEVK